MKISWLAVLLGFLACLAAIISNVYHGFYREAFEHAPAYVFEQHLLSKSIVIHSLYGIPLVILGLFKKRRKLLIHTTIQYGLIQLIFYGLLLFYPAFDSQQWLAYKKETINNTDNGWGYATMVEDLLKSKILIGKSRAIIHQMIGLPNENYMDNGENYYYSYPTNVMGAYLRIADGCHGFKVQYNSNGFCTAASFLCHDHKR